ncbi:MAG: hypothetical protein A2X56_07850 [Nitrospirae bacterium GWC2_57_13]|nr:MAG: hypothetical protein A2X56_07850 [Nitrospirae bacterium GWC2_57_13]
MLCRAAMMFALLATLLVPAGCTRKGENRQPGHLHLRLTSNPTTLDPALITDVIGGGISAKLFNGLVRFDEKLNLVPDLARSWTISDDNRTYRFRLRKGITFSNGRAVTAHDFRYSFERVLTRTTKAPLTWVLDRIAGASDFLNGTAPQVQGIRVIDDHTLSLTIDKPFGPFLSLLAMTTAYVVPREEVERFGPDFGNHPVGTGPFVLSEWKHGQQLTLKARNDYFEGSPRLKGFVYRIIPEELTAVLEFETGGLDVLLIPAAEFRRYTTAPAWKDLVAGLPGLNSYYIGLNCTRPPFSDLRVRRAMNHAIDRRRILETVYEKRGILATGPVPPGLWKYGFGPDPGKGYTYDPELARRLIREAGVQGTTIKLYISAEPELLDVMEVIQGYLGDAGLRAEIHQRDWSAFKQAVNLGEPDAFWLSWWADYPDPENFLYPLFHLASVGPAGNRTRCVDEELNRLIEKSQSTVDERQRYRLYSRAEDRIIENAPWVFMWHKADFFVRHPWVQDFRIYLIYSIDKGMDISVSK